MLQMCLDKSGQRQNVGVIIGDNEQRTLTGGVPVGIEARISHVGRTVLDRTWSVFAVEDVVEASRLGR